MASGWELNASCRVKGFVQNLKEDKFFAKLSYSIDLKTPEGKVFEKIDEGFIDQSNSEKVSDFDISTQLQLNSDYKPGKYKIIFNVTDSLSNQSVQIEKEFEL
jgi:deoxycytidine triphosphate deaminase